MFGNTAEIINFQSFFTLLADLRMNFALQPGNIMVLTYCPEPKVGQGPSFEPFSACLYSEKVSAQKVPNVEISGRLLSSDRKICQNDHCANRPDNLGHD